MALEKEALKTIEDIEALPEGTRAELLDGEISRALIGRSFR